MSTRLLKRVGQQENKNRSRWSVLTIGWSRLKIQRSIQKQQQPNHPPPVMQPRPVLASVHSTVLSKPSGPVAQAEVQPVMPLARMVVSPETDKKDPVISEGPSIRDDNETELQEPYLESLESPTNPSKLPAIDAIESVWFPSEAKLNTTAPVRPPENPAFIAISCPAYLQGPSIPSNVAEGSSALTMSLAQSQPSPVSPTRDSR